MHDQSNRFLAAVLCDRYGVSDRGTLSLSNVLPVLDCYPDEAGHYAVQLFAVLWIMDVNAESAPRVLTTRLDLPGVAMGSFKRDPVYFQGGCGPRFELLLLRVNPAPGLENGRAWAHFELDSAPVASLPFDIVVHDPPP